MNADRRDVVKTIMAGGAALGVAGAGDAANPAAATAGGLVHHVFFWLRAPGSAADRDALIAGLRTLRGIPVVRTLRIGVPAPTEQRDVVDASFDVSELMVFDSAADQKLYQDHPIHQAFVARCAPLWRKVVVYDMVDA
jgi:hypothetical protein